MELNVGIRVGIKVGCSDGSIVSPSRDGAKLGVVEGLHVGVLEVGEFDGNEVGNKVGINVGKLVGAHEGDIVSPSRDGEKLGETDGDCVGDSDGDLVGEIEDGWNDKDGTMLGVSLGVCVVTTVGKTVSPKREGTKLGKNVGMDEG